jgi:hypothetical protein
LSALAMPSIVFGAVADFLADTSHLGIGVPQIQCLRDASAILTPRKYRRRSATTFGQRRCSSSNG